MSDDIWVDQWDRVELGGPSGADYKDTDNVKILWHDWEGTNWDAAQSAFSPYPPHLAAKYPEKPRQYVPLNKHSYALLSSTSEAEFVIQIELAGFAKDMVNMDDDWKAWVAHDILEPILYFHDVPDVHPPFYDGSAGFTLASKTSPIRFSQSAWASFTGHVGHQHAPSPDDHWDPGKLDLDSIIRTARANGHKVLQQLQEDSMPASLQYGKDLDYWFVDSQGNLKQVWYSPDAPGDGWQVFTIMSGCTPGAVPTIQRNYLGVEGRLDIGVEAGDKLAHAWYVPGQAWGFELKPN